MGCVCTTGSMSTMTVESGSGGVSAALFRLNARLQSANRCVAVIRANALDFP